MGMIDILKILGVREFPSRDFLRCLFFLAVLLVLSQVLYDCASHWPPAAWERRSEQRQVEQLVQSVGGWAAIRRDGQLLAAQYGQSYFAWHGFDRNATNSLPPALAGLKPRLVECLSPAFSNGAIPAGLSNLCVIRVHVFGTRRTGGSSQPYFGLDIVLGAGGGDYRPLPGGSAGGVNHGSYRQVAEGIYEVF